jgi:hypothetical protein
MAKKYLKTVVSATAPDPHWAGLLWADTSGSTISLKIRNKTDDGWTAVDTGITGTQGAHVATVATTLTASMPTTLGTTATTGAIAAFANGEAVNGNLIAAQVNTLSNAFNTVLSRLEAFGINATV